MSQTSLKQFTELYITSIEDSNKAAIPSKRIANVIDHLTYSVFSYFRRGIFERHKLVFALMLASRIAIATDMVRCALILDKSTHLRGFKSGT